MIILKGLTGKINRFVKNVLFADSTMSNREVFPAGSIYQYSLPDDGRQPDQFAILFSGDGGWANLTTALATRFQNEGIPVAGIDSMVCFWKEWQAEQAAKALEKLINDCEAEWHAKRIVLMGYSMGADVLPGIASRLSEETRNKIEAIVLMSPSNHVVFTFRFIGWLGFATPAGSGSAIYPDVEKLLPKPLLCIAGEREKHTLAKNIPKDKATVKLLPGGHHYSGDYDRLGDVIKEFLAGI